jgi:hypothetical protein
MDKKDLCFGVVLFILLQAFVVLSCVAVQPMNKETIWKHGLDNNLELFKNYQYFVSRDIVLTSANVDIQTNSKSDQTYSNVSIERDVRQILSLTPGVALEIAYDQYDALLLGIAFETENDYLLWFYYSDADDCFYLAYTDYAEQEIAYAGKIYKVSYEQAKGIGAAFKRLTAGNKPKEGGYENTPPVLLYEKNTTVKEIENRKIVQGRRL